MYTFLLTIGTELFGKIDWLRIDQRFKQCLSASVFKFFSEMFPQYINEIYTTTNQNNTVTRNSSLKLSQPFDLSFSSTVVKISPFSPLYWMNKHKTYSSASFLNP